MDCDVCTLLYVLDARLRTLSLVYYYTATLTVVRSRGCTFFLRSALMSCFHGVAVPFPVLLGICVVLVTVIFMTVMQLDLWSQVVVSVQKVAPEARDAHLMHQSNVTGIVHGSSARHPKAHFRTYGNDAFKLSKQRIWKEANDTGWFETVIANGPDDLPSSFGKQYSEILKLRRGGGYWIWKFPVIEMALDQMDEGDVLLYADAGCEIRKEGAKRFFEYVDLLKESPFGILSHKMEGIVEFQWTTEQIFRAFNVEASNDDVRLSAQYFATFLVMKKGDHLRQLLTLINEALAIDPFIITDKYNLDTLNMSSSFIDNRHDQSLLSVSRKLLGSLLVQDDPPEDQLPIWQSRIVN